jgi:hypothetical protein
LIGENKNNTIIDGYWITNEISVLDDYGATILITSTGNADVSGFRVGGGVIGIRIFSSNNHIYDNNLSDSCNTNIILDRSSKNNVIYHNTMVHDSLMNTCSVYNDILKEGNYWWDYEYRYPIAKPYTSRPWVWDTPYDLLYLTGDLYECLWYLIANLINNYDIYPLLEQYEGSSVNNQQLIQNQQQSNLNHINTLSENQQNSQLNTEPGSTMQSTTSSTPTNN